MAPEQGGGYPVLFEFEHHLHCLNLVRKSLAWNYPHYIAERHDSFHADADVIELHVNHCVDVIRQRLMCVPDTGVFGQVWVDNLPEKVFVDFDTDHKCKNFWEIKDWVTKHQVTEEEYKGMKMRKRPGDIVLAQPP